jgi:hypothetical protein
MSTAPNSGATLYLVSCVAQKQSRRSRAKDLYVSPWFKKARSYVESRAGRWFILSAEYGLLSPDAEVDPYERTLNKMKAPERRDWARRVLVKLRPEMAGTHRVVVLAGDRYREYLLAEIMGLVPEVELPMEGLRIGEQLNWLDAQRAVR